jgi:hypothetical protein
LHQPASDEAWKPRNENCFACRHLTLLQKS